MWGNVFVSGCACDTAVVGVWCLRTHRSTAALLATSKGITSSLTRSRRVMAATASRMNDAAVVLDRGSKKLDSTFEANDGVTGTVKQSKALLRKLDARSRTDRILNMVGLLLFLGVAAYIVYRRTVGRLFGTGSTEADLD